ncbi:MAG: hypothetical protein KC996_10925 [Phycisphaerales bacterium]|nr:hypothetical protein [Phycisphaerales bacterium]
MKKKRCRRGSALVVVVMVLAILGIAVAGAVSPLVYEAETVSLRVETTRAFYAAESGAAVIIQAEVGGIDPPGVGDEVVIGGSVIRYIQLPSDGTNAILEGSSGSAVRRIELSFE